jgi:hypothetical protein
VIPENKDRVLTTRGVSNQHAFTISGDGVAHIMGILRDAIYTDRILAVLREYGANAWDAHRSSGQADRPIEIHVPTHMDPELRIRDYGPGLSQDQMFQNFAAYGASTKRDSNSAVGMLGIGSKSGFSYADIFIVISWYGGKRTTYIAALDESDQGTLNVVDSRDCGDAESGLEVRLSVKPQDVKEFTEKAERLYSFFEPRPKINVTLTDLLYPKSESPLGYFAAGSGGWKALMGCVPYRIDMEQVRYHVPSALFRGFSGLVHFEIGEVDINASREELKYSERTKRVLGKRINDLVDAHVLKCLQKIEDAGEDYWQRRLLARSLGDILQLSGNPIAKQYVASSVYLWDDYADDKTLLAPKSFCLKQDKQKISYIRVDKSSKLVIKDTRKSITGYEGTFYPSTHTLVVPNHGFTLEQVREELDELLAKHQLTGIPIENISSYPWVAPRVSPRNMKYAGRIFTFLGTTKNHKRSDNWEVREEDPEDDDIYVVISGFDGKDYPFLAEYARLKKNLTEIGQQHLLPDPIVGYKHTDKLPVKTEDISGTEFQKAAQQALKIGRQAVEPQIEDALWADGILSPVAYWWGKDKKEELVSSSLQKLEGLPASHPLRRWAEMRINCWRRFYALTEERRSALTELITGEHKARRREASDAIENQYPMMGLYEGLGALFGPSSETWIQYVLTVDRANQLARPEDKEQG